MVYSWGPASGIQTLEAASESQFRASRHEPRQQVRGGFESRAQALKWLKPKLSNKRQLPLVPMPVYDFSGRTCTLGDSIKNAIDAVDGAPGDGQTPSKDMSYVFRYKEPNQQAYTIDVGSGKSMDAIGKRPGFSALQQVAGPFDNTDQARRWLCARLFDIHVMPLTGGHCMGKFGGQPHWLVRGIGWRDHPTGTVEYEDPDQPSRPPRDEGTGEDAYYDAESGRWRSRSFDEHWNRISMGTAEFQARMRRRGYIWDDVRGGWVSVREMQEKEMRERTEKLCHQALMRSLELPPEQQAVVERMIRRIRESNDPAQALSQAQRVRNGAHLMASAEVEQTQAEAAEVDAEWAGTSAAAPIAEVVTMFAPGVSDVRDVQELISGRDMWTGRELEWWEKGLTALGVIAGSGAAFRAFFRSTDAVADATRAVRKATELSDEARRAIKEAEEMAEGGRKLRQALESEAGMLRRTQAYREAVEQGTKRADNFAEALNSGDEKRILEAVLDVKGDWEAIKALNRRSDDLKIAFNRRLQRVYDGADQKLRQKVADKYNEIVRRRGQQGTTFTPNQQHGRGQTVSAFGADGKPRAGDPLSPEDIEVFCGSNPSAKPKVGKDRDYTVRIFGQDLPSKEASELYEEALFETVQEMGVLPQRMKSPKDVGKWLDQTAVHWLDTEAYGKKDLDPILEKLWVRLTDAKQIAYTIAHKGIEQFNEAARMARRGDLLAAEKHMAEGMYQIRKQFDNQVVTRLELAREAGQKVKMPPRLESAVRLMEKVETWDRTPAEVELILKQKFGMTPQDVAVQVGEFLEALDVLMVSGRKAQ